MVEVIMRREDRESILLTPFGSSPQTRLLDLFMDNPLFEFTRGEMMEALGMAKVTLSDALPSLEASGVIVEMRKVGKASLHRLNGDSEVVRSLRQLIRSSARTLGGLEEAGGAAVDGGHQKAVVVT